jgi:hypothetical protein
MGGQRPRSQIQHERPPDPPAQEGYRIFVTVTGLPVKDEAAWLPVIEWLDDRHADCGPVISWTDGVADFVLAVDATSLGEAVSFGVDVIAGGLRANDISPDRIARVEVVPTRIDDAA